MIPIIKISKEKYNPLSTKRGRRKITNFSFELDIQESVLRETFNLYVAHYILYRIKKAVREQKVGKERMRKAYKPLSKRYRQRKPYGTKTKFWIQHNDLIRKLGVYRDAHGKVYIGFRGKKSFISSKEKLKFKKILPTLEYGSKKKNIPARPLIRPILHTTRKNINWLWRKFKEDIRNSENF